MLKTTPWRSAAEPTSQFPSSGSVSSLYQELREKVDHNPGRREYDAHGKAQSGGWWHDGIVKPVFVRGPGYLSGDKTKIVAKPSDLGLNDNK